jgi:hypothetical protein
MHYTLSRRFAMQKSALGWIACGIAAQVRVPEHDGQHSGPMADSIPAA